jgi:hypothetical protein
MRLDLSEREEEKGAQDGCKNSEPEMLRNNKIVTGPCPASVDFDLADGEDDEDPDGGDTRPAREAVMVLKSASRVCVYLQRLGGNRVGEMLLTYGGAREWVGEQRTSPVRRHRR